MQGHYYTLQIASFNNQVAISSFHSLYKQNNSLIQSDKEIKYQIIKYKSNQ